jgi:plasmid stabilization system protein ParE
MEAADAKAHVENIAEQQKQAGAAQADQMAQAVHSAADELQGQMPKAAEFVHSAASQLEKGADALRNRGVGDLVAGVNDFGRREPLALFGAAMIAGFAAARFLKSSSGTQH